MGEGASLSVSCSGVNSGPAKIVSDVPIVAAQRVIYAVNGVQTSYDEMMGLPNSQLDTIYWMPWYNNASLLTLGEGLCGAPRRVLFNLIITYGVFTKDPHGDA